ncbi:MAG: hypothetical protein JXO44_05680 [Clostridia bacterium]|nr:hypothetical protein [Clostridia bacterium]
MKKFYNHTVFLQILCIVLMIFLVNGLSKDRVYEEMVVELLRDNMTEGIESLQKNNAILLGAYMKGQIPEDFEMTFEGIQPILSIDDELEAVLGFEHRPFDWMTLEFAAWDLEELSDKAELNEMDLQYIEDVRYVNQALIDAYYDIIDKQGVSFRIGYEDKPKVIGIYKEFVKRARDIAMSDAYQRMKDFEVEEAPVEAQVKNEAVISAEEARVLAEAFVEKATGKSSDLKLEEERLAYEFELQDTTFGDDSAYCVSVDKDGCWLQAYLSYKMGGGAYNDATIDREANKYIEALIPEQYVLYDREVAFEDGKLEEVSYKFVYYDGVYYDETRHIEMTVDNYGYLDSFDQTFNEELIHIPSVISEETLVSSVKGTGLQKSVLVRTEDDEMVYWVYMKSNGAIYTLVFDAMTGVQKEVLPKTAIYYNRIQL